MFGRSDIFMLKLWWTDTFNTGFICIVCYRQKIVIIVIIVRQKFFATTHNEVLLELYQYSVYLLYYIV